VKVQRLVIWDDRRVIEVAYTGPGEVAAYLDDYAALLDDYAAKPQYAVS